MTSSTDQTASSVRATIVAQRDQMTKILEITPEAIDILEEELGGVATTIKSYHYKGGRMNGHLAVIIPQDEYRTIIEDEEWEYEEPAELEAYDENAITATVAQRAVLEARHRRKMGSLVTHEGVKQGLIDLIIYAVGEDAVVALKQRFVKYLKTSPKQMIEHLRKKTCIKMTTLEKDKYKTSGYSAQWDTSRNITLYWKSLDEHTVRLKARNIATSEAEKVTAAVACMWESGFFTEEALIKWEKMESNAQTWEAAQEYFSDLYHDHNQYLKATAKKARFETCDQLNNIEEVNEEAAKKDDAAMMFAMMQEQHQEQMNQMRESNKAALEMAQQSMKEMAAMMKAMNGRGNDNATDKENTPPNVNKVKKEHEERAKSKRNALGPKKEMYSYANRKVCTNCNQLVQHYPKYCFELEANKAARPKDWKSRKD